MIATMTRTILHGSEYMKLYPDGRIERQCWGPSDTWKVTGAVEIDNLGRITRHYTLEQVFNEPGKIPWKWKNGKQRTHITDLDHGTPRIWMNPTHHVS